MTLKARLIVLCGVPIIGLLLCAAASYILQRTIHNQITRARDESVVFADTARQMQIDVIQVQQWLTDISATRGEDGLDDGFNEAEKNRGSFLASLKLFKELFERRKEPERAEEMDAMAEAFEGYYMAGRSMAAAYVKEGTSAGNRTMGAFDEASQKFLGRLDPFVEEQLAEADQSLAAVLSSGSRTGIGILAGGIVLVSVTLLLAHYFIRSITGPIHRVTKALLIGSEETTGAAAQVTATSRTLAEGASEQAASLEETGASLEELTSMTKRNASNAREANELAKQTRVAADNGANDMKVMLSAMDAIKSSSDDIAKIIRTIDEIAFQTNILALNAAVEAARAGEAGMGFAVVADEVRNLAQRSAKAAKETSLKIEGAITRTAQGVDYSGKVAQALAEIVGKARQLDELAAEVSGASNEQSQGIAQINSAIGQMDKVTQSNAAYAEESAAAAEQLNAQASVMKQSVTELLRLVGGVRSKTGEAQAVPQAEGRSLPEVRTATSSNGRHVVSAAAMENHEELIRWDEVRMATGVESVDEQHQELIRKINDLHRACLAGAGREELQRMMDFLASYVQRHFNHEEELMDRHRCPSKDSNKIAHRKFLERFGRLKKQFESQGPTTSILVELRGLVGDWLRTHICSVDTKLKQCPSAQGRTNGEMALLR